MQFLENYQLALTPLSPIHIGSGEDFEPTNYVIEEGILYGFDPSRAALPPNLHQELMHLASGKNNPLLGIQRFFRKNKSHFQPIADVLIPVAAGVAQQYEKTIGTIAQRETDKDVLNNLAIERHVHSRQTPIIPGSSFKGALRTSILDEINQGHPTQGKEKGAPLEKRLLRGDFSTSPLRLLKIADFMSQGDLARQIWFATNHKKQLVIDKKTGQEATAKGPITRKECIAHGQYRVLLADTTILSLAPHTDVHSTPSLSLPALREIAKQTNHYHLDRLMREIRTQDARGMLDPDWKRSIENLLAGELKTPLARGDAFLVRLGRYGGAECKTLSGIANIKIMQGKGNPSKYQNQTLTWWLAAEHKADKKHLIPFGWALVEINPSAELANLKNWCDKQSEHRPDTHSIHLRLAEQKAKVRAEKQARTQAAAEQLAAAQAHEAEQAAKEAILANLSPAQRQLTTTAEAWQHRMTLPNFKKQAIGQEIYTQMQTLLKQAASEGWCTADCEQLLQLITEMGPKLITLDSKELKKKLKPLIETLPL